MNMLTLLAKHLLVDPCNKPMPRVPSHFVISSLFFLNSTGEMEGLSKQARSIFSRTEELQSTRERTPIENTASFRRENRPQNWSRLGSEHRSHRSRLGSGEEAEYVAAIAAAAAVAIISLETDPIIGFDTRQIRDEPWIFRSGPGETSNSYADYMMPEKTIHPVTSIKKAPAKPKNKLTFAHQLPQDSNVPYAERIQTIRPSYGEQEDKYTERTNPEYIRNMPTVKKTPTLEKEALGDTNRLRPEVTSPVPPTAIRPLNIQPTIPHQLETEVDAWEREQMDRIKQRYEKLNATILEWEDSKTKKARHKLERTEQSQVDIGRAKAMHKYQIEIEQIKQIAEGARAQGKGKKRNEELKVKEKANRYRRTGEVPRPPACCCW